MASNLPMAAQSSPNVNIILTNTSATVVNVDGVDSAAIAVTITAKAAYR